MATKKDLLERIEVLEARVAELEARPPQVINHYHTHYHPAPEPQPVGPIWTSDVNDKTIERDWIDEHEDIGTLLTPPRQHYYGWNP